LASRSRQQKLGSLWIVVAAEGAVMLAVHRLLPRRIEDGRMARLEPDAE